MANLLIGILSWSAANELMGQRNSIKIGHNTALERRTFRNVDGDYIYQGFAVKYHDTYVVTIIPDSTFGTLYQLSSGGFKTATTKQRIRSCAPGNLFQRAHEWILMGAAGDHGFYDGIIVNPLGDPVARDSLSTVKGY